MTLLTKEENFYTTVQSLLVNLTWRMEENFKELSELLKPAMHVLADEPTPSTENFLTPERTSRTAITMPVMGANHSAHIPDGSQQCGADCPDSTGLQVFLDAKNYPNRHMIILPESVNSMLPARILDVLPSLALTKTYNPARPGPLPELSADSCAVGEYRLLFTEGVPRDLLNSNSYLLGLNGNDEADPALLFLACGIGYTAIVRPMDIQTNNALTKICLKAALIWILSMTLAIPEAVFSDLHPFYDKHTNNTFVSCAPYPHSDGLHPRIHSMTSFLIFYVIPLSIISVYYYYIAKNLIRSAYNMPVEGNVHVRRQIESRKRLAKTVLVFVGLFAFCWLPNHVIYLYRSYHYSEVDTSFLHYITSMFARVLAFTNSCVNPFALYALSKSFRKQFNNQLFCCRPRRIVRSQSVGRSTTRMTSLKSTNHSMASFSLINGKHICHDGCV